MEESKNGKSKNGNAKNGNAQRTAQYRRKGGKAAQ